MVFDKYESAHHNDDCWHRSEQHWIHARSTPTTKGWLVELLSKTNLLQLIMTTDWRNLPAVIAPPSATPKSDSDNSLPSDSDEHSDDELNGNNLIEENESQSDEDDEEGIDFDADREQIEKEQRRQARKAKHLAKIQEVYADYLSDASTTTHSSTSSSCVEDMLGDSTESNHLQTIKYREPRRTVCATAER